MSGRLPVSCCTAMVLIALQAAAAPPGPTKPGGAPPQIAVTPTPMISAVHQPFNLPACTASGTVTFDTADHAKRPGIDKYVGSMTFTANRDLLAVFIFHIAIYHQGSGGGIEGPILGSCDCPACPPQTDNPAAAPPSSNFKRLESRTYQLTCAWPNGGTTIPGPFVAPIGIYYFTSTDRVWQKNAATCGNLTFVK